MAKGNLWRSRRARARMIGSKFSATKRSTSRSSSSRSRSLRLEQLEDKRLLATYVVNNFGDLEPNQAVTVGSFRHAVQLANANAGFDTVMFADYLFDGPGTGLIPLDGRAAGGQLDITDPAGMQILGPGAGVLSIFAGGNNRHFFIDDGDEANSSGVTISGVTLSGGSPLDDNEDGHGGSIFNRESLTLQEVDISNNFAPGGGAVFNESGFVQINRSLIRNNTSLRGGGGVLNGVLDEEDNLPTTTILNSTITGNTAIGVQDDDVPTGYGGGVFNRAGTVNIAQSTIYGNSASVDGGGVASQGFDPELDVATITDDFESGDLTAQAWTTGGAASWAATATNPNNGGFSAQAGLIGDNETSFLEITFDTEDDVEGEVGFSSSVSSELGGDVLTFFIDGVATSTKSGDEPYAEETYIVTPGTHTFRWEYTKNGSDVGGTDTAFIDDFFFRPSTEAVPGVTEGNAITHIRSSIIVGNTSSGLPNDVASSGMTEDPAVPFEPQINSQGYNVFGVLTHPTMTLSTLGITLPPDLLNGDIAGVDPTTIFIDDPFVGGAWLNDFGGVLPVFMPDINKLDIGLGVNLAIDRGDPSNIQGDFDNRGSQFSRADISTGLMDVGAAEVQAGNFVVSTLVDELDGRYSEVEPISVGIFPDNLLVPTPDFSLREAIGFAQKNSLTGLPAPATITFSGTLGDKTIHPDPTPLTEAQTLVLSLGQLSLNTPVNIVGPTSFELEIDATGNDPTPVINNGDGSRVFSVATTSEIRNLIIRGGDQQVQGGGIITAGDLTLRNVTLLDSFSTGSGGGISVVGGTLLLDSTTIHDNGAAGSGGGLYIASGDVTVHNSTISGNAAALHGGGIANADGSLLVRYSTISENTASSTFGSGLVNFRDATASTVVRSSIISGNTLSDIDHAKAGANYNIVSQGYNLVGTGSSVIAGDFAQPGDQTFADAMLGPLIRLGGSTPVHRPLPGSPAIDAGDPTAVEGVGDVPVYDQRGFPFDRIEDDIRIDIGAYEVQNGTLFVGDGSAAEGSFATFTAALAESNLASTDETIVFLPTWAGEFFPEIIEITDTVDIVGSPGFGFAGAPALEFRVDDSDDNNLIDVSFSDLIFQNNVRFVSRENLAFTDSQFNSNVAFDDPFNLGVSENGGAISQELGKLTITGTDFIGNSTSGGGNVGGAIYVNNGELEINDSLMTGNSTGILGGSGGAIYVKDSTFTGSYLYLTGNAAAAATADGGAFYALNSTVSLSNAIISGNSTGGSNSEGGAIAFKGGSVSLVDTSVSFNTTVGSQSRGGAIFADGGILNIQGGNIALNSTGGISSSGGAIASAGADVTITGANINNNTVTGNLSHGGGIYSVGGNLTVRDSSIVNNTVTAVSTSGGGIYTEGNLEGTQTTLITNSTVSGNTATHRGGGVYNAGGLLEIDYSTITNNSVPFFGNGGGVASLADSASTRTEVHSSIIAGNHSTDDPVNPSSDVESVNGFNNSFVSLGYNVIGTGLPLALDTFVETGDQANVADPGLAPLSRGIGEPTFTHALEITSPALNTGDPNAQAGLGDVPMFDQRGAGFSRVELGRIDVGAYESAVGPIIVIASGPDFDGDDDIDGFDFLAWQRGFGKASGVTQSDGDADNSGTVDAIDLEIWETDYGTGVGGGPVFLTTGDEESLQDDIPLPVASISEPLPQVTVLAVELEEPAPISASFLAGTSFDASWTAEASTPVASEEIVSEATAESTEARDQLFAGFSALDADRVLDALGTDADDAELSDEDQVFDLLGAF